MSTDGAGLGPLSPGVGPEIGPDAPDLETGDLLEETETRVRLRCCPVCFEPFGVGVDIAKHIRTFHDAADFGLGGEE